MIRRRGPVREGVDQIEARLEFELGKKRIVPSVDLQMEHRVGLVASVLRSRNMPSKVRVVAEGFLHGNGQVFFGANSSYFPHSYCFGCNENRHVKGNMASV